MNWPHTYGSSRLQLRFVSDHTLTALALLLLSSLNALAQDRGKDAPVDGIVSRTLSADYCNIPPLTVYYSPSKKAEIDVHTENRLKELMNDWSYYHADILIKSYDSDPGNMIASGSGKEWEDLIARYFTAKGIPSQEIWTSSGPTFQRGNPGVIDYRYRVEVILTSRVTKCILDTNKKVTSEFQIVCQRLESSSSSSCGKMSEWLYRNIPQ